MFVCYPQTKHYGVPYLSEMELVRLMRQQELEQQRKLELAMAIEHEILRQERREYERQQQLRRALWAATHDFERKLTVVPRPCRATVSAAVDETWHQRLELDQQERQLKLERQRKQRWESQQEEEEQRKAQQSRLKHKEHILQEALHKARISKITNAAVCIQRQYRAYLARRTFRQRKSAADKIESWYLKHKLRRQVSQAVSALAEVRHRAMSAVSTEIDGAGLQIDRKTERLPFIGDANKQFLTIEETLTRILLQVDEIQTHNDADLRSIRKAIVHKVEQRLDEMDKMRRSLLEKKTAEPQVTQPLLSPTMSAISSSASDATFIEEMERKSRRQLKRRMRSQKARKVTRDHM